VMSTGTTKRGECCFHFREPDCHRKDIAPLCRINTLSEVAHAAGLGILFPAWIQHLYPHNPLQFQRWAVQIWNAHNLDEGMERMKATLKKWGAPVSLRELGVTQEELNGIKDIVMNRRPLGALKPLGGWDVEAILSLAW
jgi:alcohol dehydrogenase